MVEPISWSEIGRVWGPLGLGYVLLLLMVVAGAKWFKSSLTSTTEDARRERDYARQQRERESDKFLESLRVRDELMKKGFEEVLHELRNNRRK